MDGGNFLMCWLEYCERSSTFSAARLENPREVGVGFFSFDDSNCAVLASLEPEFGCSKTCLRICIEPCFWNVRAVSYTHLTLPTKRIV